MNISPELLEKVQKENKEFRGLYEKHTSLKQKVDAFNKMKIITPEQELEKKINQFQGVSFKLAEMETQIQASRQLIYHAAWLKDNNKDVIKDAAIAKLFSSEAAMKITTEAKPRRIFEKNLRQRTRKS